MPKLKSLEGLRGLAALMVVYCHFILFFVQQYDEKVTNWVESFTHNCILIYTISGFINFFSDGELAVYIFWLMSAYVISISLWDKDFKNIFPASYFKRYIRLLVPIMASVFIAYILLTCKLIYSLQASEIMGKSYNNGWLYGMYRFDDSMLKALWSGIYEALFHYNRIETYNSALWSMEKEWWGSVICFSIILLFSRPSKSHF